MKKNKTSIRNPVKKNMDKLTRPVTHPDKKNDYNRLQGYEATEVWIDEYIDDEVYYCKECKQECNIIEETFDYSGTHCTGGRGGIHHTGFYHSDCCIAEYCVEDENE